MVKSMTGYGRAEKTIDGREITVEMRAVNNRYLDLTSSSRASTALPRTRSSPSSRQT